MTVICMRVVAVVGIKLVKIFFTTSFCSYKIGVNCKITENVIATLRRQFSYMNSAAKNNLITTKQTNFIF